MKNFILTTALAASVANAAATSGKFTALSYNVAGLPQILQGNEVPGDKTENSKLIGSLFAKYGYDIIHAQEDFNYHASIYETDNHVARTATSKTSVRPSSRRFEVFSVMSGLRMTSVSFMPAPVGAVRPRTAWPRPSPRQPHRAR